MTAVDGTGAAGTSAAEALAERLFAATLGGIGAAGRVSGRPVGLVPRAERSRPAHVDGAGGPDRDRRKICAGVARAAGRRRLCGRQFGCRSPVQPAAGPRRCSGRRREPTFPGAAGEAVRRDDVVDATSTRRLSSRWGESRGNRWAPMLARSGATESADVSPSALSAVSAGSHRPARHTFGRRAGR